MTTLAFSLRVEKRFLGKIIVWKKNVQSMTITNTINLYLIIIF